MCHAASAGGHSVQVKLLMILESQKYLIASKSAVQDCHIAELEVEIDHGLELVAFAVGGFTTLADLHCPVKTFTAVTSKAPG